MTSDESHVDEELVDQAPIDTEAVDTEAVDTEPASGDPRVDAAMRRAAELVGTSPTEHVEIYEDVHRSLQEVLADASGQPSAAATDVPGPEAGDAAR
jgi:hypothetical protein